VSCSPARDNSRQNLRALRERSAGVEEPVAGARQVGELGIEGDGQADLAAARALAACPGFSASWQRSLTRRADGESPNTSASPGLDHAPAPGMFIAPPPTPLLKPTPMPKKP